MTGGIFTIHTTCTTSCIFSSLRDRWDSRANAYMTQRWLWVWRPWLIVRKRIVSAPKIECAVYSGQAVPARLTTHGHMQWITLKAYKQSATVDCGVSLSNAAQRIRQFAVIAHAQQLSSISYMGKLIPAHYIHAVATQGVSKRNPCWPGWQPVVAGR